LSLQAKILKLIAGVTDPTVRIDVASTINYVFGIYVDGTIDEREARNALRDICMDVVSATYPELTEEEVRKKVSSMVEEFMRAFKLESSMRRMLGRFRPRYGLPL